MAAARPLRDVFADLVGDPDAAADPAAFLRDQGHPGLPDQLVAEAVVSYADTAPVEVAEHLAPYVTAHSVVGADPAGDEPPGDWADLLGTAPDVSAAGDIDDLAPEPVDFDGDDAADLDLDLDFGTGAEQRPARETEDGPADLDDATGWVADEPAVEPVIEPAVETAFEPGVEPVGDLDGDADDDEPDDEPLG